MPRIDPQQLLKCLSVLLSPKGGIKSKDEVQRLASLMTKFSKKLVSKCIYVSILKATETDLLIMFMSAGGWDLTFTWLSDGVGAKNWPLVTELVELLLICPVDIDRLKTNACPKLIKTLSKDSTADENVRLLACKLVEQWLRVVRGDSEPAAAAPVAPAATPAQPDAESAQQDSGSEEHLPVYKITIRNGEKVLAKISGARTSTETAEEECSPPTSSDDVTQEEEEPAYEPPEVNDGEDDDDDDDEIKPVKIKKRPQAKAKPVKKPAKVSGGAKKERDSTDSASSVSSKSNKLKENAKAKKEKVESPKVKPTLKNKSVSPKIVKDSLNTGNETSSLKKADESLSNLKHKAKLSLSLKNKKLANKDKKEMKSDYKEKNILDEDDSLTEKEKESIKKLIAPPISKLGKIPKKTSSNKEEKQSEEKNRTLKEENGESKSDLKKSYDIKKPEVKRQEKNFSIGVDRKAVDKGEKPKTVKMYNSKFRSTGLEEEVKPPPPRPVSKKPPPPLFPSLGLPEKKLGKRMSPPPEPHIPEKKPKPESPQDDKKPPEKAGGIKLIPPKPKRKSVATVLMNILNFR